MAGSSIAVADEGSGTRSRSSTRSANRSLHSAASGVAHGSAGSGNAVGSALPAAPSAPLLLVGSRCDGKRDGSCESVANALTAATAEETGELTLALALGNILTLGG